MREKHGDLTTTSLQGGGDCAGPNSEIASLFNRFKPLEVANPTYHLFSWIRIAIGSSSHNFKYIIISAVSRVPL